MKKDKKTGKNPTSSEDFPYLSYSSHIIIKPHTESSICVLYRLTFIVFIEKILS